MKSKHAIIEELLNLNIVEEAYDLLCVIDHSIDVNELSFDSKESFLDRIQKFRKEFLSDVPIEQQVEEYQKQAQLCHDDVLSALERFRNTFQKMQLLEASFKSEIQYNVNSVKGSRIKAYKTACLKVLYELNQTYDIMYDYTSGYLKEYDGYDLFVQEPLGDRFVSRWKYIVTCHHLCQKEITSTLKEARELCYIYFGQPEPMPKPVSNLDVLTPRQTSEQIESSIDSTKRVKAQLNTPALIILLDQIGFFKLPNVQPLDFTNKSKLVSVMFGGSYKNVYDAIRHCDSKRITLEHNPYRSNKAKKEIKELLASLAIEFSS